MAAAWIINTHIEGTWKKPPEKKEKHGGTT